MTAMKPILDLIIDANILICFAYLLWRIASFAMARTRMRRAYPTQLTLMKTVLVAVIASPVLAALVATAGQAYWPQTPVTASDIAVAAFLRGDIAMSALQFEALLGSRDRLVEAALDGSLPVLSGLLVAFTSVALILGARALRSVMRVHRAVSRSYVWRKTGRTDIRLSHRATVPFAARGLFRRHVVLPFGLVTHPRDMRFALAHEFQHLRQADVEWEILVEFLRPLFFWNPAFLLWKREFDRLRELSCDQAVVSGLGFAPRDYARCLLDFCERRLNNERRFEMTVGFVWAGSRPAKSALKERILALQAPPPPRARRIFFYLLVPLVSLGIVVGAAVVRKPSDWSHDRLMLSTVVNLERYAAINRGF